MASSYKVVGPGPVDGHEPGETITAADSNLNFAALVQGGLLKPVASKTRCPSCEERKAKGHTKEYTSKQLADHYKQDHPGLQPPAGEEE